jgi:hypothetical protein
MYDKNILIIHLIISNGDFYHQIIIALVKICIQLITTIAVKFSTTKIFKYYSFNMR